MDRQSRKALVARTSIAATLSLTLLPQSAQAKDPSEVIAVSALEFGGAAGNLLLTAMNPNPEVSGEANPEYMAIAMEIKRNVEMGRASARFESAQYRAAADIVGLYAVTSPEPLTKASAAIAAYGLKVYGDLAGQDILDRSQAISKDILARGIQGSGFTPEAIKSMKPEELREKVTALRLGNETIGQILVDQPDALRTLQAHSVDIATEIGVEAFSRVSFVEKSVSELRKDLTETTNSIEEYQKKTNSKLQEIETSLVSLEKATVEAGRKLDVLQTSVDGNTRATQLLSEISYSGWSTSQKLQAVQGGVFPDIKDSQRTALIDSLKADQKRENLVAEMQELSQDFGNLAAIANNIGLPKEVVRTMQGAQTIATGVAKFATADYLGAVASVTSLVGLNAPDAAAGRHAAMMKYLDGKFAEINERLDRVIKLQVKTFEAIALLNENIASFREDVFNQLDQIEGTVLRNERMLQAILLGQWTSCHSFINGSALNGQFLIPDLKTLGAIVDDVNTPRSAQECYDKLFGFLNAWVLSAKWSGQIIAAGNFPTKAIQADTDLQKRWLQFQLERERAFFSAKTFLRVAIPSARSTPAKYLVRLTQPVSSIEHSRLLRSTLADTELLEKLDKYRCNSSPELTDPMAALLCHKIAPGVVAPPKQERWSELIDAALIGPHALQLLDVGNTLSRIVDFSVRADGGMFDFVSSRALTAFATTGPNSKMQRGIDEGKGLALLRKLQLLAEAYLLQQGLTYGDYTAQLIEETLYDKKTNTLLTSIDAASDAQKSAIQAMRDNPVLARNVVLIAMRHAIENHVGGPDKAKQKRYRSSYYQLALDAFSGPEACKQDDSALYKLRNLLPGWKFEYRVSEQDVANDSRMKACPAESHMQLSADVKGSSLGTGPSVTFEGFYISVPSELALLSGRYQRTNSLMYSLRYRDKLSQAVVDRTLSSIVGKTTTAKTEGAVTLGLLGSAWNWQTRDLK